MKRLAIFCVALCAILAVNSCDDDEEDFTTVALDSYIVGSWKAYQVVLYDGNTEKSTSNIGKTGRNADIYVEMDFQSDKATSLRFWEKDTEGVKQWTTYNGTYSIIGRSKDVVLTIFNTGTAQYQFDRQSGMLYRDYGTFEKPDYTAKIYYKKDK